MVYFRAAAERSIKCNARRLSIRNVAQSGQILGLNLFSMPSCIVEKDLLGTNEKDNRNKIQIKQPDISTF